MAALSSNSWAGLRRGNGSGVGQTTAAGTVTSVITTGSVQRMNLKEGDTVFAIIKATEVSVEKE
jgi:molybdopterin-binding protein